MRGSADGAQGVFNKEAMIRKILVEYSPEEATWIWWVDIDTVVANIALPLPLEHYDGYQMVAWGRKEHILEGHMNDGELILDVAFESLFGALIFLSVFKSALAALAYIELYYFRKRCP